MERDRIEKRQKRRVALSGGERREDDLGVKSEGTGREYLSLFFVFRDLLKVAEASLWWRGKLHRKK